MRFMTLSLPVSVRRYLRTIKWRCRSRRRRHWSRTSFNLSRLWCFRMRSCHICKRRSRITSRSWYWWHFWTLIQRISSTTCRNCQRFLRQFTQWRVSRPVKAVSCSSRWRSEVTLWVSWTWYQTVKTLLYVFYKRTIWRTCSLRFRMNRT